MKRERNPNKKRRQIIDATHRVLREGNYFENFTIDKVAKYAGVSKGGVLHHFPTKDSLLQAAARDIGANFESRLLEKMSEQDGPERGKKMRAYVDILLDSSPDNPLFELSPLLLSYSSMNEDRPVNQFDSVQTLVEEDGSDYLTATIVRLAADGLLYTELIDKRPIPAKLKEQIHKKLIDMLNASDT